MKKIGLFYATKADKTTWVAEKIQKEFGKDRIEVVPIEQAWQNDFAAYDCLIVGASTWFDGELPTYWDELLPELRTLDLKGKKVAVFGLGDQIRYPETLLTESDCLPRYLKETGPHWSVLLLPKDTLSNVPERCVVIGGAVWSSIWIINPSKRKRESGNGANR